MKRVPIIAIVGRPNVGKSTFFNRVLKSKVAVVEDVAGVTRDRNYALVERFKIPFYIVDTGGFEKDPAEELQKLVVEQALLAAEEADLIVALFDGKAGCRPGDRDVVDLLRRYDKPVVYGVNKCDGVEQESNAFDFYELGVEDLQSFSALHGRGVDAFIENVLPRLPQYEELLADQQARREREEDVVEELEAAYAQRESTEDAGEEDFEDFEERADFEAEALEEPREPSFAPVFYPDEAGLSEAEYIRSHRLLSLSESEFVDRGETQEEEFSPEEIAELGAVEEGSAELEMVKVALIGRPNVGKSTLLNTLTGEQRAITSPIAGTTRDSINTEIERDGQRFLLVDTAGIRRKVRVSDKIEKYSSMRALHAISECDVAVVLLNAEEGPTDQDGKIVGLAHEAGKGIIIAVNKWDCVEKDHRSAQAFKAGIKDAFKFAPYAPLLFISAKSGKRCSKILEEAKKTAGERQKRVTTYQLNKVLRRAVSRVSPPSYRGRPIKLFYAAQVDVAPPRFLLVLNYPQAVHFSYLRFLKNAIREAFGFYGTDVKLATRKRRKTSE